MKKGVKVKATVKVLLTAKKPINSCIKMGAVIRNIDQPTVKVAKERQKEINQSRQVLKL